MDKIGNQDQENDNPDVSRVMSLTEELRVRLHRDDNYNPVIKLENQEVLNYQNPILQATNKKLSHANNQFMMKLLSDKITKLKSSYLT